MTQDTSQTPDTQLAENIRTAARELAAVWTEANAAGLSVECFFTPIHKIGQKHADIAFDVEIRRVTSVSL